MTTNAVATDDGRTALPFPKWRSYVQSVCGGRWLCIHSCNGTGKYVPVLSLALCTSLVVGFFTYPGGWEGQSEATRDLFTFRHDPDRMKWQTVLLSFFSQVHGWHLVFNVLMLLLAGVLLEVSEGSLRFFCIAWGAQTLSMGLHGGMDGRSVVGSSGVSYGMFWAQLALLALNWSEMSWRYVRLVILGCMALSDVISIFCLGGNKETTAAWAHLGGALASISIALVMGVNVRRREWEWMVSCLGLMVYVALVLWVLAEDEPKAGVLAALLLPIMFTWALYDLRPVNPNEGMVPWEERTAEGAEPEDAVEAQAAPQPVATQPAATEAAEAQPDAQPVQSQPEVEQAAETWSMDTPVETMCAEV